MNFRILFLTLLIASCSKESVQFEELALTISNEKAVNLDAGNWLVGGTLQLTNGLEWQKVSFQNKRATCGSFLQALQLKNKLRLENASENELRAMSEELVLLLNDRFRMSGNAAENEASFKHLKVSSEALSAIKSLNWYKNV